MKQHSFPNIVSLLTLLIITSCSQDYYPVGIDLFSDQILKTETEAIPVFAYQESVEKVQSNVQPLAQLGKINHPVFGTSEASIVTQLSIGQDLSFGNLRQTFEDAGDPDDPSIIQENETVKEVYLEIPFFSNTDDADNDGVIDSLDADPNDPNSNSDNDELSDIFELQAGLNPLSSDSDGDGILDHNDDDNSSYDSESKNYQIDSIYGNRQTQFNLQVHELTYYLNTLDSQNNFETAQIFYSNRDYYEEGFVGATLYDAPTTLDFNEIRFYFSEDDPDTPDIDETTEVETRLSPRLRIPLDTNFFQKRLFDIEGSEALLGDAAYQQIMRGFIIRGEQFSDDLYMLLDIQNAEVKIVYEFDDYNTQGTIDDLTDDTIEKAERELVLRLGGNRINTLKNSAFNSAIEQRLAASKNNEPVDRLFIQSSRLHGKIRLFSGDNPDINETLEAIRSQSLLINEANLLLYIDPELTLSESLTAQRLYLFNFKNGAPLIDYFSDGSVSNFGTNANKRLFGGILEFDDSGKPYRYKFNLTNHVSNIVRNDSLNYDLGIVVSANIEDSAVIRAQNQVGLEEIKYPLAATLNPLGTILVGSHPNSAIEDKRIRLELVYSSY